MKVLGREEDGAYCGNQATFRMIEYRAQKWSGVGEER